MLKFHKVVLLRRALVVRRAHLLLRIGDIFIVLVDKSSVGWFASLQQIVEVSKSINEAVIVLVSQDLVVKHLIPNLIG